MNEMEENEIFNESNQCTLRRRRPSFAYMRYLRSPCLRQKIYEAARDGIVVTLLSLLKHLSQDDVKRYLNELVVDGQNRCTPLIIAAKNGHENVVRMLLMKFKPELEIEGSVQFDGYLIEGTTALWTAAGAGHLNVVKTLVSFGADVNHSTKTNSTPLRAACFDGRLDIVSYLVANKANIHISNKYNNTCLMIAAYKGHLEVVSYLLSLGSDPNEKARCGASALHFAAENGHLSIIKELLKHSAMISKNEIGITPLMAAAERTKAHVVEYFISTDLCSEIERIEALELLGASYANDKDAYNLEKAFYYLEWAMRLRHSNSQSPLKKRLMPLVEAYNNHKESETLEELEAIQGNSAAIHMEALVIRERVLGPKNPEVPHPVIFRGAVYADSSRFDRCLQLWLHALRLRTANSVSIRKDLLRFAQVFSQMLNVGTTLPSEILLEVLSTAFEELKRNKDTLSNCDEETMNETLQEELDDNIHTTLYLLVIVTKIIKYKSKNEELSFYRLVYQLNRLKVITKDGSTLLHLCINAETPVDDFHTKNVCKFPCAITAKLLISCGADVNAFDSKKNTPLHIIVAYQKPISDFLTLHAITSALIEAGSHMDAVNEKGETPFEASTTGVAEIILKTHAKISLKCLAARAITTYKLNYLGEVPSSLIGFIKMHGSSTFQNHNN